MNDDIWTVEEIKGVILAKYAGRYTFYDKGKPLLAMSFETRPNFIKRFFMKYLLGILWEDNKNG